MLTFQESMIENGTKSCVNINITNDMILEDTESLHLTLSNPSPASIVFGPNPTVRIIDDDSMLLYNTNEYI